MASNLNQTTLGSAIKTEYERRLLTRALPRLVHGRDGMQARINKYGSYELRRYESLSVVTSTITEGTTPAEQSSPSLSVYTITPSFYGAWIGHTDILEMVAYDPIIMEVSGILGEQCGLSADTIVRNALTDNATDDFSGGETARTSLIAQTDLVTFADFLKQVTFLEAQNARPAEGDDYVVICHPYTYATWIQDPTFANLFVEEAPDSALRTGYIGRLLRCRIYVTSNQRSYAAGGSGGSTPYSCLFLGSEAFGTVGIANTTPDYMDNLPDTAMNGMTGMQVKPVEIIVKPVGSAGANDPLNQRGTIAWKMSLAVQVLNANWIRDLEHITAYS
jgi:N4-gp56 family major capsid protein